MNTVLKIIIELGIIFVGGVYMNKRQKRYLKSYYKGVKEFERQTGRQYTDYGEGRGEPTLDLEDVYGIGKKEEYKKVGFLKSFFEFFFIIILIVIFLLILSKYFEYGML